MASRELYCTICAAEMLFETPPCPDGYGPDCDEMMCVGCGTALFVAPIIPASGEPLDVPDASGPLLAA